MRDVAFCTDSFGSSATREYSELTLSCFLWALIFADEAYLLSERGAAAPGLYDAGIVWKAEEPTGKSACEGGNGQEQFLGVRQVIRQGWADCEDVASWRVAELRLGRVPAVRRMGPFAGHPKATVIPCPWPGVVKPRGPDVLPAFFSREISPGSWVYHIVVFWPDGTFEDPSRVLGMGGARKYG